MKWARWIILAGMLAFLLLCIFSFMGCVGTSAERDALRTLTPLPVHSTHPASGEPGLSEAALQLDALTNLKPIH